MKGSGDKVLCISGDTGECDGIYQAAENADIAIIESTVPPDTKMTHLSGTKAAEIAKKAGVKKLVLTHVIPYYGREQALRDAKKIHDNVVLAEDLMKIE